MLASNIICMCYEALLIVLEQSSRELYVVEGPRDGALRLGLRVGLHPRHTEICHLLCQVLKKQKFSGRIKDNAQKTNSIQIIRLK